MSESCVYCRQYATLACAPNEVRPRRRRSTPAVRPHLAGLVNNANRRRNGPRALSIALQNVQRAGCRLADQKIASRIHLDRVMAIMYNWKDVFWLVSIFSRKNKLGKSSIRSNYCDRLRSVNRRYFPQVDHAGQQKYSPNTTGPYVRENMESQAKIL